MTDAGARPVSPSSKLALYLSALIAVYLLRDPIATIAFGFLAIAVAGWVIARAPRRVPKARWRVVAIFIAWVFVMRAALDLVAGSSLGDANVWLAAARQAVRVGVLAIGVVALIAVTTAR